MQGVFPTFIIIIIIIIIIIVTNMDFYAGRRGVFPAFIYHYCYYNHYCYEHGYLAGCFTREEGICGVFFPAFIIVSLLLRTWILGGGFYARKRDVQGVYSRVYYYHYCYYNHYCYEHEYLAGVFTREDGMCRKVRKHVCMVISRYG